MFSARLIYSIGILVSVSNIVVWATIIRTQLRGYKNNASIFRTILLVFTITSLFSNIIPIWFDIYRLINNANPTNIFYAYVINSYMYRTITALLYYILYKY